MSIKLEFDKSYNEKSSVKTDNSGPKIIVSKDGVSIVPNTTEETIIASEDTTIKIQEEIIESDVNYFTFKLDLPFQVYILTAINFVFGLMLHLSYTNKEVYKPEQKNIIFAVIVNITCLVIYGSALVYLNSQT